MSNLQAIDIAKLIEAQRSDLDLAGAILNGRRDQVTAAERALANALHAIAEAEKVAEEARAALAAAEVKHDAAVDRREETTEALSALSALLADATLGRKVRRGDLPEGVTA